MATKGGVIRWFGVHLILVLCFINTAFAELTPEQQAAKDRGIAIFNQYRVSGPELRIAAEAGDAEAQF